MIIIRRAEKTVGVVGRIVMKAAATSMMAAVMAMMAAAMAMMAAAMAMMAAAMAMMAAAMAMMAAAMAMMAAAMAMTVVAMVTMVGMSANASPAKAIGSKSITRALTKMARNLNQRMTAGLLRPFDSVVAMS